MILKYQISEKEYREAQRAQRAHLARGRLLFRAMPPIALGAAILGGYSIFLANNWVLGLGLWAATLFLLYSRYFSWRRKARWTLARHPEVLGPFEIDLTEQGIRAGTLEMAADMSWAEGRRYYETLDLFLFSSASFSSGRSSGSRSSGARSAGKRGDLLILPKRVLPAGDMQRWMQTIREQLKGKGRRENPDAALLKFAMSWAILGVFLMVLFVGSVHTFLMGRPRRYPAYSAPKVKGVQDTRPAGLNELQGSGTVYLVPVEKPQSVISPELLAFFRKKYGVELKVLAPMPVPAWAQGESSSGVNPVTVSNRLIAEELMEAMKRAYPQYANDPDAILIGITDRDMYISESDWAYAFSDREEERFAVISTARMDPVFWKEKPSPEALQLRARKMLTKDIGLLYFHLQPSTNYSSVLYNQIGGTDDLDDMGDGFLKTDAAVRAQRHLEEGDPCFTIRHYYAPAKARADAGSLTDCSGQGKELDLEIMEVDLRYGLLLDRRTDFYTEDRMPLKLQRVLRTQDSRSLAFGIGGTHNLNIFPVGDRWPFTWIDLIMADGGRVHYKRSNWGFGYWDANYQETSWSGNEWSGSTINWNWPGWKLEESGGRTYYFGDANYRGRPEQGALTGIRNSRGDRLTLQRDASGNLLHARTPGGQWIDFQYDGSHRILQAQENGWDRYEYSYDADGHLARVKDENGRVTDYSYDAKGRITTVTVDGKPVITNEYDAGDRVIEQTLPEGRTYSFHYTLDRQGKVAAVDVIDSQGLTRKLWMSGGSQYTMQPVR